jgi:signal transduction histidine kinase
LWHPSLLWVQVSSNLLIGLSYVAIATTLGLLVLRVRDMPFKTMYLAFGIFIVSCGITHFFDVWVIWTPDYWLDGGVRIVTAVASVGTALALPPLVPKAVALARGAKAAHDRGIALETAVADLGSLYEKTRELEQLKTQFFANVSHELRTPLTLILGPIDKLRHEPSLSEAQRRDLDVVYRNTRTLLKHVNDLLDIARLEAGKAAADYVNTDAAEMLRLTAAHFDGIAEERRIAYEVIAPASAPAQLDQMKIERVLLNLLSNAFKFTPEGGRIVCELENALSIQNERVLVVRVADTGPGIPPHLRSAVFERFRQLDGSATRSFGGTGLGLAICKDFVELHQGSIEVSEAPDGGALFTLTLPERAPPGSIVREISSEHERVSQHMAAVAVSEFKSQVSAIVSSRDDERPLVLVVEDNREMNRFICETLSKRFRTLSASDGQEGVRKAREALPDVILTDLMMPKQSGEGLVKELRDDASCRDIPVMLLSAKADEELRVELLRHGAQDYLMKPFSSEELLARIGNLVSMKRARDVLQKELDVRQTDVESMARDVALKKRDLETAYDALRVARDHAERASMVKSNFLRLVSHELRTPLTVMRLQIDRLNLDTNLAPQQRQVVSRMAASLLRLSDLLEAVLEHTRIESGRLVVAEEEFDASELALEVVEEYRPQAELKGLRLTCASSERLPAMVSDRRLLRLILGNLVGNAVKFTGAGSISVEVALREEEFVVHVSDTGPGIAPELQSSIFEPFYQLEPTRNKHTPGVGLGLSLVQEMISALGGRVELVSRVAEGSTFTVCLPRRPLLARAS